MTSEEINAMVAEIDSDIEILVEQINQQKEIRNQFVPGFINPTAEITVRNDQILELRCRKNELLKNWRKTEMSYKKKFLIAFDLAKRLYFLSRKLETFLQESEEKNKMLEEENKYLARQCAFSTWNKQEYARLQKENAELKSRIQALQFLVEAAIKTPAKPFKK